MTAQPQWKDSDQGDLLALVATGPLAPDTADREWDAFVYALRQADELDGWIHPNRLRRLVRVADIKPQRVGAFTHRALSRGLVAYTGDYATSDDTKGRNSGKPARIMRWIAPTDSAEPNRPLGARRT